VSTATAPPSRSGYQAASAQPSGALRGWFQHEPGYELEDGAIVIVWTPVLRGGKPTGQAPTLGVVDNNRGSLQREANCFDWDLRGGKPSQNSRRAQINRRQVHSGSGKIDLSATRHKGGGRKECLRVSTDARERLE
jgi:hypothetical protein